MSRRGSDGERERVSHQFLSCTFRDLRGCFFFYSSFVVVFVSLLNDRVCSYIENQQHNEASLAGLFPLTVQVLCHMLPLKTKASAAELACCRQHWVTARPEYQSESWRVVRFMIPKFKRGTVKWKSHSGGWDFFSWKKEENLVSMSVSHAALWYSGRAWW